MRKEYQNSCKTQKNRESTRVGSLFLDNKIIEIFDITVLYDGNRYHLRRHQQSSTHRGSAAAQLCVLFTSGPGLKKRP